MNRYIQSATILFAALSFVGRDGYYWFSTPGGGNGAYDLYFSSGGVSPARSLSRYSACAVRLVTDVK